MDARISLDLDHAEQVGQAVSPSLTDRGENQFETGIEDSEFRVQISTRRSGPLRGCMDAAMRLSKLGEKVMDR